MTGNLLTLQSFQSWSWTHTNLLLMRTVQLFLIVAGGEVGQKIIITVLTGFPVGDLTLRSPAAWPHPQELHHLRQILRMILRHYPPTVAHFFWHTQERDIDYLFSLSLQRSGNEENSTRSGRRHTA